MARQKYSFAGRPRTATRQTWEKTIETEQGLIDVTPAPGNTYTRETWPPRGRGRGESLTSPRRIAAKMRAAQVLHLRCRGYTFEEIARTLGFKDASGPYRAMRRAMDRIDWDRQQEAQRGYSA